MGGKCGWGHGRLNTVRGHFSDVDVRLVCGKWRWDGSWIGKRRVVCAICHGGWRHSFCIEVSLVGEADVDLRLG